VVHALTKRKEGISGGKVSSSDIEKEDSPNKTKLSMTGGNRANISKGTDLEIPREKSVQLLPMARGEVYLPQSRRVGEATLNLSDKEGHYSVL